MIFAIFYFYYLILKYEKLYDYSLKCLDNIISVSIEQKNRTYTLDVLQPYTEKTYCYYLFGYDRCKI